MQLDKHIIPVLIDSAEMPLEQELPQDMKPFARRQALHITALRSRTDAAGVVEAIKKAYSEMELTAVTDYRLRPEIAKRRLAKARQRPPRAVPPRPWASWKNTGFIVFVLVGGTGFWIATIAFVIFVLRAVIFYLSSGSA